MHGLHWGLLRVPLLRACPREALAHPPPHLQQQQLQGQMWRWQKGVLQGEQLLQEERQE